MARGDFNDVSDIDVIIITKDLPGDRLDRSAVLHKRVPPLIESKAYTKDDSMTVLSKKNPIALATLDEDSAPVFLLTRGLPFSPFGKALHCLSYTQA